MRQAPFDTGKDSLFIAYYASAEINCFHVLGWSLPMHVLDLFTEFRCMTNGLPTIGGSGLLGALQYHGLPSIETMEKDAMRQLAMRGGNYTLDEKRQLLDYCESDVVALDGLLPRMLPRIDLPRALLRGRYMAAAAGIEHNGVPIDMPFLNRLRAHWEGMKSHLIAGIDAQYGVYEGQTFKMEKFAEYLRQRNIPWPILESGKLDLKDDTFRDMAKIHPELQPLKELRATLSGMRLSSLAVGGDGYNRSLLSAFRSRTGRNQPSNSQFIFGPAVWMRGLIKPAEGYGIAYIDWSQQEFGIAAALSGDPLMMQAYHSGDPYLEFAKQAGAVPQEATKQSHKKEREQFKACVLAVQYGMGADSLGRRIGQPPVQARYLLELHRKTYRRFWEWSDAALNYAMLNGRIHAAFGWTLHVGREVKERTILNFPMQANGAEMIRLACIYGIRAGVKICAPVHDALLIEAPVEALDEHIALMQEAMVQASRDVLEGFELRSDVKKFIYPDRYMDERGEVMWKTIETVLQRVDGLTHVRESD